MKRFVFLSLVLAGLTISTLGVSAQETKDPAKTGSMMKADTETKTDGAMMKSADSAMMVSEADKKMSADPMDPSAYNLKGLGKQVSAWTSVTSAMMDAKNEKLTVVYFFAATWCPDCQATYKDLKANYTMLPANFKLVFVNYDRSADLKEKYGITVQHTFLMVGPHGEKKKVWNGGNTVAELIKTATAM